MNRVSRDTSTEAIHTFEKGETRGGGGNPHSEGAGSTANGGTNMAPSERSIRDGVISVVVT